MLTPFDKVIDEIKLEGYHNHRRQKHSDIVCEGIFLDLQNSCGKLKEDFDNKNIKKWINVNTPGARGRKIDLLIGEPDERGEPDLEKVRICVENKSVITAHRNRDARFDDLNETLQVLFSAKAETVMVATILVGIADKTLNVPDRIGPVYRDKPEEFKKLLKRFSTGDSTLWDEFPWAVSKNKPHDPEKTIEKFRQLNTRKPGHTHVKGYDFILIVPVHIDNVNPPYIARSNNLGIDFDSEYQNMLKQICDAYYARWHL